MKKKLWLLLSSFGIMFAIFSWMQESNLIAGVDTLKWQKGIYSLFIYHLDKVRLMYKKKKLV